MITMLLQSAYSVVDGLFVSNLVGDTSPGICECRVVHHRCHHCRREPESDAGRGLLYEHQAGRTEVGRVQPLSEPIRSLYFLRQALWSYRMLPSFLTPLLKLMGASGNLLTAAGTVRQNPMIAGGVIQVLSCGLAPILRNENRQVGAMTIFVLGFLSLFNLTMDFLLLYFFHLGMGGVALPLFGQAAADHRPLFSHFSVSQTRLRARLGLLLPGSAGTSLSPHREQFVLRERLLEAHFFHRNLSFRNITDAVAFNSLSQHRLHELRGLP